MASGKATVLGLGAVAVLSTVIMALGAGDGPAPVDVSVPTDMTAEARTGQRVFADRCATCHGDRAQGTQQGPPLVHIYYEPNHHADGAFHLAVRNGVTAHHWRFGDMPPQPGVTPQQVEAIIAYVRALQKANGIF